MRKSNQSIQSQTRVLTNSLNHFWTRLLGIQIRLGMKMITRLLRILYIHLNFKCEHQNNYMSKQITKCHTNVNISDGLSKYGFSKLIVKIRFFKTYCKNMALQLNAIRCNLEYNENKINYFSENVKEVTSLVADRFFSIFSKIIKLQINLKNNNIFSNFSKYSYM